MHDVDLIDPISDSPLNNGLVAWWLALPQYSGGRTWHNLCGRKFDGAVTNVAFPASSTSGWHPTTRPGGWGEMRCDGTDDRVRTAMDTPIAAARTICAWARFTSSTTGFIASACSTVNNNPHMSIDVTAGTPRALHEGESGGQKTAVWPGGAVATGWHHIVGVFASTTSRSIYVDGVFGATNTQSVGADYLLDRFSIGCFDRPSPAVFFFGRVDDVRIFNRVLSAAEIAAIYQDSLTGRYEALRRIESPVADAGGGSLLLHRRRRAVA